jgi:hypothetical protein
MSSKLLWFYQPEFMTMYDEYARRGLAIVRRPGGLTASSRGIRPQKNYLQYFEQLFEDKTPEIDRAAMFSDRTCPYPRRVLDQWLWLQGSKDKADYLRVFILPLDRASISPRDSDSVVWLSPDERGEEAPSLKDQILAISRRCASLPDRDLRSAAEILAYDEYGLPR